MHPEEGEHQQNDHAENGKGFAGASPFIRRGDGTPYSGNDYGQQSEERHQVEDKSKRTVHHRRKHRETYAGEYAVENKFPVGNDKDNEGPEYYGVVDAERPAQHPFLAEGVLECRSDTGARITETVTPRTKRDQAQAPVAAPGEQDE